MEKHPSPPPPSSSHLHTICHTHLPLLFSVSETGNRKPASLTSFSSPSHLGNISLSLIPPAPFVIAIVTYKQGTTTLWAPPPVPFGWPPAFRQWQNRHLRWITHPAHSACSRAHRPLPLFHCWLLFGFGFDLQTAGTF